MNDRGNGRVLSIRVESSRSAVGDILPAARGVCREVRRLEADGFDLRHFSILAHLALDDRPIEPTHDLALVAGELKERPKRG